MKNKVFYLPKFQDSGILPESTEYYGGNLNSAKVFETLSRDQWNNLYKQGKISLSQIPRKYQSWVEGENSDFKQNIINAMDNFGTNYVAPVLTTALSFSPIIGGAVDIAQIGLDLATGNLLGAGLSILPGFGNAAKKSIKTLRSAKKTSWRDPAIYLRNWDSRHDWKNFSNEELRKHVSPKTTEKAKDKYLSQIYKGQYTTSPEEQFVRVNNTGNDRVKWIEEHPVKELPNYTTLEEQIQDASRSNANEYINNFRRSLDENVTYSVDPKKMREGEIAWTEGSILNGICGTKPQGKILTIFSKEDKSPFAQLTLGHEAAIHGSGNLDDAYIYQYLKENDIIDFNNVSPYFKDTNAGEIGAHFSEVPSYLGFKKETPTSKYQTPEGKTKINKDDIENYLRFQKEHGADMEHSIFNNVKDWPKFLEFINGHKFIWTLPLFGVGAANIVNKETNENTQTRN